MRNRPHSVKRYSRRALHYRRPVKDGGDVAPGDRRLGLFRSGCQSGDGSTAADEHRSVCVSRGGMAARDAALVHVGEGPTCDKDILSSREQSFKKAQELVARVAQQLQAVGFQTTTATPDSDPRHGIIDCAADWKADLIVMGSHERRGLDKLLLGSVAEAVMRRAVMSVSIRAPGIFGYFARSRSGAPEESPISSTAR